MRRRTLQLNQTLIPEEAIGASAVAGDICLYDKTANKLTIVPFGDFSGEAYPADSYSPVGVVAVPGTHNIYGTRQCGIMSLCFMDNSTPQTGGINQANPSQLYYGGNGVDVFENDYGLVNYAGSEGVVEQSVQGVMEVSCLPSDLFDVVPNPYDTATYYKYDSTDNYANSRKYIPSPYTNDGSRNENYYTTNVSEQNCCSDFGGVEATKKMVLLHTTDDLETTTTVTNNYDATCFPAAACCYLYHTAGTKKGDWYLPAFGELGYVMARFSKINDAIALIQSVYGESSAAPLVQNKYVHSSSEATAYKQRALFTGNGSVNSTSKATGCTAYAFLRL